jgi:hypothetical protein
MGRWVPVREELRGCAVMLMIAIAIRPVLVRRRANSSVLEYRRQRSGLRGVSQQKRHNGSIGHRCATRGPYKSRPQPTPSASA